VTVTTKLARRLATGRESQAIHHVVETALESRQQVVTSDAWQRGDVLERVPELLSDTP
jgi:hypothetical protein